MTGDRQAGEEDARIGIEIARMEIAQWLARAQVAILPAALVLGLAGWLALLVVSWRRREWHSGHVLVLALVLAMGMRVALLGFLAATSIPRNDLLYLTPAAPMALAFMPCVLFLGLDLLRRKADVAA